MNLFALFFQSSPAAPGIGGTLIQFAPIIMIFAVFYFLILVPQRRRQRELQELVSNLKAGDRIITNGGIIATITAVRETTLLVRSADKTMLEISRASVAGLHAEEQKG